MEKEQLREVYRKYAEMQGFLLQPDEKILDTVLNGLIAREKQYGFRYCPCRRVTGNKDEDKKIICPCVYHKDEIKNDGHCKCLLFLKKE